MNSSVRNKISASMSKERPFIRKAIIRKGIRPFIDPESDILMGRDCEGRLVILSDGWRKQMCKMIAEGYFADPAERESFDAAGASNTREGD